MSSLQLHVLPVVIRFVVLTIVFGEDKPQAAAWSPATSPGDANTSSKPAKEKHVPSWSISYTAPYRSQMKPSENQGWVAPYRKKKEPESEPSK